MSCPVLICQSQAYHVLCAIVRCVNVMCFIVRCVVLRCASIMSIAVMQSKTEQMLSLKVFGCEEIGGLNPCLNLGIKKNT